MQVLVNLQCDLCAGPLVVRCGEVDEMMSPGAAELRIWGPKRARRGLHATIAEHRLASVFR